MISTTVQPTAIPSHSMHRRAGVLLLALAMSSTPLAATDWPQFRGPDRLGTVTEDVLDWAGGAPEELWRRPIGAGFSAVAAVGDRLYTMDADAEQERLLALDAATGATVWSTPLGETPIASEFGHGPRTTPTVVDGVVYAATSGATLVAARAATGEILWRRELGRPAPRFGYASSPLVVEVSADGPEPSRLVIAEVGSEQPGGSVVAFDAATGEPRWSALDGPANYSSPALATLAGTPQLLFSRRAPEVVALSLDGDVLWRHETGAQAAIPLPLPVAPDRVFVASSDDGFGGLMLRVEATDDGDLRAVEVWSNRLMRNHFNASVVVGDHLYGFDNATFKCLDAATGERRWAKRGFGKGSLVAAGDVLFVLADDGVLAQVRADPAGYRELGRVQATTGKAWTEPTLAHGRLIVRDHDEIVAYAVGGRGSASVPGAVGGRADGEPTEDDVESLTLDQVLGRHAAARGGAEAWAAVDALEARGTYAAFSESSDFTLLRARGEGFLDHYRLDFRLMGAPATRARDAVGAWHQHALLQPEPGRLDDGPYRDQLERESLFGPVLLRALAEPVPEGFGVTLVGPGDVGGRPTIDLEVRFPDGDVELWSLDAATFLEARVEGEVHDFTQRTEPMRARWFFSDFRRVGEVVLPFRVEWEFGARLETMAVDAWQLAPDALDARFSPPSPEPVDSTP